MPVKIRYVKGITKWLSPNELRDKIYRAVSKGEKLKLSANFGAQSQMALLKALEEQLDAEITTSYRLSAPIESRSEVSGRLEPFIDPSFIGISTVDPRLAVSLTKISKTV